MRLEKIHVYMDMPQAPTPESTLVQSSQFSSKLPLILGGFLLILASGFGGVFLGKYLYAPRTPVSLTGTPTPTPNPTAHWKTYTSNTYKFQIGYPEDWNLTTTEAEANNGYPAIYINSKNTTLTLYLPLNPDADKFNVKVLKEEVINLGEEQTSFNFYLSTVTNQLSAYSYEPSRHSIKTINFYLDKNNEENHLNIIKQILSTFKFLDRNVSQECGVCGPQGDHNITGDQCAPGLECTNEGKEGNVGELRMMWSSVYYCVKPGESINKCILR